MENPFEPPTVQQALDMAREAMEEAARAAKGSMEEGRQLQLAQLSLLIAIVELLRRRA